MRGLMREVLAAVVLIIGVMLALREMRLAHIAFWLTLRRG